MTDVLAEVIGVLRIRTTMFAMADLTSPWGVEFPAGTGAYFHLLDGGGGWLTVGDRPPVRLEPGRLVLLAHGSAHRLTCTPGATAPTVFDPVTWTPNRLVSSSPPPGETFPEGVRSTLACGSIEVRDAAPQPLLRLLPELVVFDDVVLDDVALDDPAGTGGELALTLRLLRAETRRPGPGSGTVLARLGDILLVQMLRHWLAREDREAAGWLSALSDPQIGAAITAMHADPAAAWTLDSLAGRARLSRSRFAERFGTLVGESPLAYLARWRLNLAATLLRDGGRVGEVSRRVGYTSEPAFSRAFSRQHGYPPSRLKNAREAPVLSSTGAAAGA